MSVNYSDSNTKNLPSYVSLDSIKGAGLVGGPISVLLSKSPEQGQPLSQSDLEKALGLVALGDLPTHFTASPVIQSGPGSSPNSSGTGHTLSLQFYQKTDGEGVSFIDGEPYMFNRNPKTNGGDGIGNVFPRFLVYTPKKIAVANEDGKKVFLPATRDPIQQPRSKVFVVDDGLYFPDNANNFQGYPIDSSKPLYVAGMGVFTRDYSPVELKVKEGLIILDGMQRGSPRQLESRLLTFFSDDVLTKVREMEQQEGDEIKALVIGPMTDEFALGLREIREQSQGDPDEFQRLLTATSNPDGKNLRDMLDSDEERSLMVGLTFLSEKQV
ncbi:hypothetical protein CMO93_02810 [Candidatus Woesearchaeota archaeon]|nr:hypothetical protein [Candidatus Woesearchaeota archaeon]|tara:strand:+ start:1884 stop:2864 length:981 start_codon:yes stop_codon:yes gene_type:complete